MKQVSIGSEVAMREFGEQIGKQLKGGEMIELVGDVGAGKTTLVKGLAVGLNIDEDIQSPTFTISRVYPARDGFELSHYDFYRLSEPGILASELAEVVMDPKMITVIEWGEIVSGELPDDRLTLAITPTGETTRQVTLTPHGERSLQLAEGVDA